MTRRVPAGAWFVLAAALLALAFFGEFVLQPGRILAGSDMLNQGYQLRNFALEEIRAGRGFPLWNPFVYGGLPYLAVLPGPVFYPTSLLYLAMPLGRAIGWTFVLHLGLSGGLGWWAARAFGLGRWGAAVTGLAWMFTGFVVSTLDGGHDGRMFAMVWIPAAFGCIERGLETERAGWWTALGLVVALQIFTPHVQIMYYAALLLSLYAFLRIGARVRRRGARAALRPLGLWTFAFALAGAVGAAQLLPTARILEIAVRGGTGQGGYGFASSWALPPQELTAFFLPDLIGTLRTYWGANPFKQHTEYLGAVPLALAALGVAGWKRDRRIVFAAACAALGVSFALGAATPVHRMAYHVVPFVDRFRAPSLILGAPAFFVALLAGVGWERALATRREGGTGLPWIPAAVLLAPVLLLGLAAALSPEGLLRWAWTAWFPPGWQAPPAALVPRLRLGGWLLLFGIAAALGTAWMVSRGRWPRAAVVGLLVLTVIDLWRVDARFLETVDPDRVFAADPLIERMQETLEPGERVFPLPDGSGRAYGANELMLHRVPAVTGMQNFRLEWYERLVGGLSYANLGVPNLWSLLDLRYILTSQEVRTPLLEDVGAGGRARLWEVAAPAPHAWFPAEVVVEPDTAAALRRVLAREVPRAAAVVEAGPAPPAGSGTARVVEWTPNRVVLEVEAERGGLLQVSEIWHPAWRARVDQGPFEPVLRTDVAFRGVVVPAGPHTVEMAYDPSEFTLGFLVTGVALALALGVLAREWRRSARGGAGRGGGDE